MELKYIKKCNEKKSEKRKKKEMKKGKRMTPTKI